MTRFTGWSTEEAAAFAARWLPAWTGNRPEALAEFYAEDVFYSDPAVPRGLRGKASLRRYFRRLLARYPTWVWFQRGAIPLEDGFLNMWRAEIPAGAGKVVCEGVCTVQFRDGLIRRNEVFFDPGALP